MMEDGSESEARDDGRDFAIVSITIGSDTVALEAIEAALGPNHMPPSGGRPTALRWGRSFGTRIWPSGPSFKDIALDDSLARLEDFLTTNADDIAGLGHDLDVRVLITWTIFQQAKPVTMTSELITALNAVGGHIWIDGYSVVDDTDYSD